MTTNPARQETDSLLEDLEKRIAKEYSQAAEELQEKAHKYFQGFEERDKAKLALVNSGKLKQEEYLKWRSGAMMYDKRYTEMINDLTNTAVNADKAAMDIVNSSLPETFRINANYGAYEVERASGIDTNFTLYNKDAVADLIKNQPDLLPKPSVDIPLDRRWNRQHMNSAITQGILQGEDIRKISKRLQAVTDMDKRAAVRNARTMTTTAENAGAFHSYERAEKMGIKGQKMWMATHDGRTRDSHAMVDGETRKLDEKFSNGLQKPGDIEGRPEERYNCRCRIVYVSNRSQLKQYYDEQSKKVVIDGKSYDTWKQESYAKWAKRHEQNKQYSIGIQAKSMSKEDYINWQKENSTANKIEQKFLEKYGVQMKDAYRRDDWIDSEKKWLSEIADDMKEDLFQVQSGYGKCGYIQASDGSKAINAYLRRGEVGSLYSKQEMQKTIDSMNRLIDTTTLDSNLLVDRCAGIDAIQRMGIDVGEIGKSYRIGHAFCTDGVDFEKVTKNINENLVGAVLTDNGFMSASVNRDSNIFGGSDVTFTIFAPKGTNAFISDNISESEIVFKPGTQQEVIGAKVSMREAMDYEGKKEERKTIEIFLKIIG